jgi:quercetin dioxygenase-like cupin family protein
VVVITINLLTVTEMKKALALATLAAAVLVAQTAHAQSIEISSTDSRTFDKGPVKNFTGSIVRDPMFAKSDQTRVTVGQVTFEPGARSAWHTHPAGQILIVTSGTGWIQQWGGQKRVIKAGDVIWIPPGVKHWHGATATTGMSHIAIQEMIDGRNVDWLEAVSDQQYRIPP